MKRFRGGLVFKAHRLLYHSTLGLRVIKKKKKVRLEHCDLRSRHPYLTQSVFQVVLQNSIPSQIRQLILYKDKLTNLCWNRLWQNDFINTLGEMKVAEEEETRVREEEARLQAQVQQVASS